MGKAIIHSALLKWEVEHTDEFNIMELLHVHSNSAVKIDRIGHMRSSCPIYPSKVIIFTAIFLHSPSFSHPSCLGRLADKVGQ